MLQLMYLTHSSIGPCLRIRFNSRSNSLCISANTIWKYFIILNEFLLQITEFINKLNPHVVGVWLEFDSSSGVYKGILEDKWNNSIIFNRNVHVGPKICSAQVLFKKFLDCDI